MPLCPPYPAAGSQMNEEQSIKPKRTLNGDWRGTVYGVRGDRHEWQLSLGQDGSYNRRVSGSSIETLEHGRWSIDECETILELDPTGDAKSQWTIREVTGCEGTNTILVLRLLAVASRNLPIMLYRVHLG